MRILNLQGHFNCLQAVYGFYRRLPILLFALGLMAPAFSEASLKCEGVFSEGGLQAESLVPRLNEIIKTQKPRRFSEKAYENIRRNLKDEIELAVQNVRDADDLLLLFKNLTKMKNTEEYVRDAVSSVDFLAPLRDPHRPWPSKDLQKIESYLENMNEADPLLDKRSLQLGLLLFKEPARSKEVLVEILESQSSLAAQFLYSGSPFHRSFIKTIAGLPKPVREDILVDLRSLRELRLKKFRKGKYQSHDSELDAKLAVRDVQFLQVLLLRSSFVEMIKDLNSIYSKSGADKKFYLALEKYLLPLRLEEKSYSFSNVIDAAKSMQMVLKSEFSKDDFVEIFGSLPNLNANLKSSDIDVIFSQNLDWRVLTEIKGGIYGDGGITPAEIRNKTGPSKELAMALAKLEKQAGIALGISRAPGKLLGISTFPRTMTQQGVKFEESPENFMRFLTVVSNVSVVVTPDQVIIRIYDSLSPALGLPPTVYDFPLAP